MAARQVFKDCSCGSCLPWDARILVRLRLLPRVSGIMSFSDDEEAEPTAVAEPLNDEVVGAATLSKERYLSANEYELARLSGRALGDIRREKKEIIRSIPLKITNFKDLVASQGSAKLTTGIQGIDFLLDGGISSDSGEIIELRGSTASGKTALCLNILRTFVRVHKQRVIFVDTCNNFDIPRFRQVFTQGQSYVDDEKDLTRISLIRAFTSVDLIRALQTVAEDTVNGGLLIIDSFSHLISPLVGKKQVLGNAASEAIVTTFREMLRPGFTILLTSHGHLQENGAFKSGIGAWWRYTPHHVLLLAQTRPGSLMCRLEATSSLSTIIGTTVPLILADTGVESTLS
jgi:hypothetical protein